MVPMTRVKNQKNRRGSRSTPELNFGVVFVSMPGLYINFPYRAIVHTDIVRKDNVLFPEGTIEATGWFLYTVVNCKRRN